MSATILALLTLLRHGWCLRWTLPTRRAVLTFSVAPTLMNQPTPALGLSTQELVRRGMREFQLGEIEASLASFDAAEASDPRIRTRLWQRGKVKN